MNSVKWVNFNYDLSLCRNYRNLKNFIEHQADESWPFFQKRFDYLHQIKFFSKTDLVQYYPNENLDEFLEKNDSPYPVYDRHFFSHLALQLIFFKISHIENLLDYHFRTYIKYKPDYEDAFLNTLENSVVGVIEQNQINNFVEITAIILKWIRRKREFLELKSTSASHIKIVKNEFIDMSVTYISNLINNSPPPIQTPPTQSSEKVKTNKAKVPKKEFKIIVKKKYEDNFIAEIFELIDAANVDLTLFDYKIKESMNGATITLQYRIARGQIRGFCLIIRKYYTTKMAFPGTTQKYIAEWVLHNFVQQKGTKEHPLSYETVYAYIKGSKK